MNFFWKHLLSGYHENESKQSCIGFEKMLWALRDLSLKAEGTLREVRKMHL